ncbi:DUF5035 family protein [Phocaeicola sp.]|uniref:DUF5035 family protein n=1 Tax=Phocaeicola sp. TaxID=2773926 RepID=UPI003AB190F8
MEKLSVKVDSDNNSVEGEDYANKMDNLPTLKVGVTRGGGSLLFNACCHHYSYFIFLQQDITHHVWSCTSHL